MKKSLPLYTIIILVRLVNACDKDAVILENEDKEDIKDNNEDKKDDPTYQLVWNDEFNGEELDSDKWNYEIGGTGWGNNELQYYTSRSENVRVEDGCLVIEAKKESYVNRNYTSARINSKKKGFVTYGIIEARISLPSGKGTWPAFWMMPETGSWPSNGEIDIMEHIGSNPTMISHAVHTKMKNGSIGNNWHKRFYKDNVEGEFHTYKIEWIEEEDKGDDCIIFYVDDEQTAKLYQPHLSGFEEWPFEKDFFVIFNMAIGGNMGGQVDNSIFDSPILMKVDWIRIYQKR